MDFYEKTLRVVFYHENDQDGGRRLELIKSICGDKNPTFWQLRFPSNNVKLKKTDWQILKEVRRIFVEQRRNCERDWCVTRTVKRRLSFMTETSSIYSFAMGNVKRMPGMAYFFLVSSSNEKNKQEIDEQILSRLETAILWTPPTGSTRVYAAVFPNMSEADDTYRWIRRLGWCGETKNVNDARNHFSARPVR